MTQYTVKAGDTLFKIAQMFGTSIERILELNPAITNPNLINVGQVIVIESGGPQVPQPCPPGNLLVNSSFENWPDPAQPPIGWQINNIYHTNLSNYGNYAAELGAAAPNRQATLSQTVDVSEGSSYRLEFYVREQYGGVSQYQLKTQVIFYTKNIEAVGQVDTVISQSAIPNNSFQLYTLTTEQTPLNTARAEVRFTFIPSIANDNTVIIDNVVFYCLP